MMIDNRKFKLIFALLAFLLAVSYKNLEIIFSNLFSLDENFNFSNKHSIEREIIKSWDRLLQLPSRNLNRNLKVAVG